MISRSTARPLRSNFVTGRSAHTPALESGLGVERRDHVLGVRRPVGRQAPDTAGSQPRGHQRGEVGLDETTLVVARLGPRVGEEGPQLLEPAGCHQVLQGPDGVDRAEPDVLGACGGDLGERGGHAGAPDLQGEHVVLRPRGGQDAGRLPHAAPDLHDQRGGASEPLGEVEAGLVDVLVRDHPARGVGVPGLLLGRGEPAAPAGVAQHLTHATAVLGELLVRPRGRDLVGLVVHGAPRRGDGVGTQSGPGPREVRGRPGGSAGQRRPSGITS